MSCVRVISGSSQDDGDVSRLVKIGEDRSRKAASLGESEKHDEDVVHGK